MPDNQERPQHYDIATSPPLWARFALDPTAARIITDASNRVNNSDADVGYATASDLPNHLMRAALLANFLEAKPSEQEIMLATARAFLEAERTHDEAYSAADF